jgi:hypothetical protein
MPDETIELALGLSRRLRAFKHIVPFARHFGDLGLDPSMPNFPDRIRVEMDNAVRIHFNLTGMRMLNAPNGVLTGPVEYNTPGSTNWELRTICDNPALLTKTVFYWFGRVLSQDQVRRLP